MTQARPFGRCKTISTQALAAGFKGLGYVQAAVLFGSRALGRTHPRSDYDFALLMTPLPEEEWGMQARAWGDVCALFGLKEWDVDIVDMQRMDEALKHSIQEGYLLLKGDENEVRRLLS